MISLITYHDVSRLTEERRRRALAKYEAMRTGPIDSFVRPRNSTEAEVIELAFPTACQHDSIGA